MNEITVYGTIEIKATGKGTPEEVFEKAVQKKKYEVISAKIGAQPADNYISLSEYARKHHIADGGIYLRKKAREGRIPGALKISGNWCIPANTPNTDLRISSGKWIGSHTERTRRERLKAEQEAQAKENATDRPE